MHEYIPKKDKADLKEYKIERDLYLRKAKNQKRMKLERTLECFVLNLDLDWDAFHYMLWVAFGEVGCDHEHTLCRRILELMNLEGEAIERCLSYFILQRGGCDCEVAWNVDMTEPKPLHRCDAKTNSVPHRAQIPDGIYAAFA
jgi:hypothetical protein